MVTQVDPVLAFEDDVQTTGPKDHNGDFVFKRNTSILGTGGEGNFVDHPNVVEGDLAEAFEKGSFDGEDLGGLQRIGLVVVQDRRDGKVVGPPLPLWWGPLFEAIS